MLETINSYSRPGDSKQVLSRARNASTTGALVTKFKGVLKMKTYNVYFSDAPGIPAKFKCKTKKEAAWNARFYIKQWGLAAVIERIEEVKEIGEND